MSDLVPAPGKGPARGYSWAPFTEGNSISTRHGAYSPRLVGERAELVRADLLRSRPDLADDPEALLPLELYCRAVAREELSHEGIERMAANGPISTRLLEAASAAARVARELGDALGVGPRAAAELHQIRAETALSMAVLAREAPAVLAAIQRALAACGLEERGPEVFAALSAALLEVEADGN